MTNSDVRCGNCGQGLGSEDAVCPECGRPAPQGEREPSGEGEVYLMLLTANVLRLRREWELAEAKCSEVLQRDPENAAVCSVLGDVARDQGRLRDAIEWYKLALDRNPGGAMERRKLEAVIDQVFSPSEGTMRSAWSALGRGCRSVIAEFRTARPHGPMGLVVGTILAVILLVAISTVLMGRKADLAQPPQAPSTPIPSPRLLPPVPSAQPVKSVRAAPPDMVARESELLALLQAEAKRLDPNAEVTSAEINPLDATIAIRVSMPRQWVASRPMRESILRVFSSLAGAAVGWDGRVSKVWERCELREPGGATKFAVVAESTKEEVETMRRSSGAGSTEAAFRAVWWAPDLSP